MCSPTLYQLLSVCPIDELLNILDIKPICIFDASYTLREPPLQTSNQDVIGVCSLYDVYRPSSLNGGSCPPHPATPDEVCRDSTVAVGTSLQNTERRRPGNAHTFPPSVKVKVGDVSLSAASEGCSRYASLQAPHHWSNLLRWNWRNSSLFGFQASEVGGHAQSLDHSMMAALQQVCDSDTCAFSDDSKTPVGRPAGYRLRQERRNSDRTTSPRREPKETFARRSRRKSSQAVSGRVTAAATSRFEHLLCQLRHLGEPRTPFAPSREPAPTDIKPNPSCSGVTTKPPIVQAGRRRPRSMSARTYTDSSGASMPQLKGTDKTATASNRKIRTSLSRLSLGRDAGTTCSRSLDSQCSATFEMQPNDDVFQLHLPRLVHSQTVTQERLSRILSLAVTDAAATAAQRPSPFALRSAQAAGTLGTIPTYPAVAAAAAVTGENSKAISTFGAAVKPLISASAAVHKGWSTSRNESKDARAHMAGHQTAGNPIGRTAREDNRHGRKPAVPPYYQLADTAKGRTHSDANATEEVPDTWPTPRHCHSRSFVSPFAAPALQAIDLPELGIRSGISVGSAASNPSVGDEVSKLQTSQLHTPAAERCQQADSPVAHMPKPHLLPSVMPPHVPFASYGVDSLPAGSTCAPAAKPSPRSPLFSVMPRVSSNELFVAPLWLPDPAAYVATHGKSGKNSFLPDKASRSHAEDVDQLDSHAIGQAGCDQHLRDVQPNSLVANSDCAPNAFAAGSRLHRRWRTADDVCSQGQCTNSASDSLSSRHSRIRLDGLLARAGSGIISDVEREIAVLKKLDHPNIVKLCEVIDDPSSNSLLLVMEHVQGGSLEQQPLGAAPFNRWAVMPEALILHCVHEICQGLGHLHANHVVHGDLKPANLLRGANGRIKIVDFGSAMMWQETTESWDGIITGSPPFRAPETLLPGCRLTRKVDIWALGVCMFQWVCGVLPFTGATAAQMFDSVLSREAKLPANVTCSSALRDVIFQALQKDPEKRLSLEALISHPWLAMSSLPQLRPPASSTYQALVVTEAEVSAAISVNNRSQLMTQLLPIFQEVRFEEDQVIPEVAEAVILLIFEGIIDTVLMTSPPQRSTFVHEPDADFSLDGGIAGCMSAESMTRLLLQLPQLTDLGGGQVLLESHGPGQCIGLAALMASHSNHGSSSNDSGGSGGDDGSGSDGGSTGTSSKSSSSNNKAGRFGNSRGNSKRRTVIYKARTHVTAFQTNTIELNASIKRNPALADFLSATAYLHSSNSTINQVMADLHLSSAVVVAAAKCATNGLGDTHGCIT